MPVLCLVPVASHSAQRLLARLARLARLAPSSPGPFLPNHLVQPPSGPVTSRPQVQGPRYQRSLSPQTAKRGRRASILLLPQALRVLRCISPARLFFFFCLWLCPVAGCLISLPFASDCSASCSEGCHSFFSQISGGWHSIAGSWARVIRLLYKLLLLVLDSTTFTTTYYLLLPPYS